MNLEVFWVALSSCVLTLFWNLWRHYYLRSSTFSDSIVGRHFGENMSAFFFQYPFLFLISFLLTNENGLLFQDRKIYVFFITCKTSPSTWLLFYFIIIFFLTNKNGLLFQETFVFYYMQNLSIRLTFIFIYFFITPRSLSSCQCRTASSKHTSIVSLLIFPVCPSLFLRLPLFPFTSSSPEMHMSYALFPSLFLLFTYPATHPSFPLWSLFLCLFCSFIYGLSFFSPWVPPSWHPFLPFFMMLLFLKCKRFSRVFRGHYSSLLHLLKIHWL